MADKPQNTPPRRPVLITYDDPDTEGPSDEELAFEKFRTEFSESEDYAKITVYRQPTGPGGKPGQKKLAFLFECGIDEYSFSQLLSKLRDEYGTGTYRMQARGADGSLQFNRAVEIEATKHGPANRQPESTTDLLRTMQEMMAAQQERTEAMLARLAPRNPAPVVDPMAMMTQSMGIFTQMLAAMGTLFAGRQGGGSDFVGELKKLAELKSVAGTLFGAGGDEDDDGGRHVSSNIFDVTGKLIDKFGPAFLTAAANMKNQTPALPPVETTETPKQPEAPVKSQFATQVAALVRNAKNGVPAETMAQTILSMTPEDKLGDLEKFVSGADAIEKMAAVNPEVRNLYPWFQTLKNSLVAELQSDGASTNLGTADDKDSPDTQ